MARFPETQWSRVIRAGQLDAGVAREALEPLCRDYWYPLYALARRRDLNQDDAADAVQEFLTDLIERGDIATVDPTRGRFRSFLCAAFVHSISRRREHDHAAKRGGRRRPISIDRIAAEGRYDREPSHEITAERLFERRWALDLLARVLDRLESDAIANGNPDLFARLRPALTDDAPTDRYRIIAADLNMTEGAVKAAAHRLRQKYRQLLREEVLRTVADPGDVAEEIAHLWAAVGPVQEIRR